MICHTMCKCLSVCVCDLNQRSCRLHSHALHASGGQENQGNLQSCCCCCCHHPKAANTNGARCWSLSQPNEMISITGSDSMVVSLLCICVCVCVLFILLLCLWEWPLFMCFLSWSLHSCFCVVLQYIFECHFQAKRRRERE